MCRLLAVVTMLAGSPLLLVAEPPKPAEPARARIAFAGSLASYSLDTSAQLVDGKLTTRFESVIGMQIKEGFMVNVRVAAVVKNLADLGADTGMVAQGTLDTGGKDLVLVGDVRPRDEKARDAKFPKGSVRVEGEATTTTADLGKGPQTVLAVKDGPGTILLVGKIAAEKTKLSGRIRVMGTPQGWDKRRLLIAAETIEEVKK
jgi:hypothetical protein